MNPGCFPTTTNSSDSFIQCAAVCVTCVTAKSWPSSPKIAKSWGTQKHLGCWCGSAAAWQFCRCWTSPHSPSPRCPSPRGVPRELSRREDNQCSQYIGRDGCCVWVTVWFMSCGFSLLYSIYPRHWLRHVWRCFVCIGYICFPACLG